VPGTQAGYKNPAQGPVSRFFKGVAARLSPGAVFPATPQRCAGRTSDTGGQCCPRSCCRPKRHWPGARSCKPCGGSDGARSNRAFSPLPETSSRQRLSFTEWNQSGCHYCWSSDMTPLDGHGPRTRRGAPGRGLAQPWPRIGSHGRRTAVRPDFVTR